jgi:3-hydroxyacyl-CoA dehydrogenase
VEVYGKDRDHLERATSLYRGIGKFPVILKKPVVGHIANRLASALWREAVDLVANDVATPEDVDQALVQGPGLRWSVMGAHMAYHLGGGKGGIRDYLRHLGPSQERRWSTLRQSSLTPALCERIAQGVERAAGGQSISDLEAVRDMSLSAVLRARRTIPE